VSIEKGADGFVHIAVQGGAARFEFKREAFALFNQRFDLL
jgi:hypothetical protein